MVLFVSSKPIRIGICTIKTQNKFLVQLEGNNLPQIGSYACVARNGQYIKVGRVTEAIGLTRSPWIVISAQKNKFEDVQINENLFVLTRAEKKYPRQKKGERKKRKMRD